MLKDKIAHIQKLLTFLGEEKFVVPPGPFSDPIVAQLIAQTKRPWSNGDRDVVEVTYSPAKDSHSVVVFMALESRHNGDFYDKYTDSVPVSDAFADFTIKVLRNEVHNKIHNELLADESRRMSRRVEARMKELGL